MKIFCISIASLLCFLASSSRIAHSQNISELNDGVLKNMEYPIGRGNDSNIKLTGGKYCLSRQQINETLGCIEKDQKTKDECEHASQYYTADTCIYELKYIEYKSTPKRKNNIAVVIIYDGADMFWPHNSIPFDLFVVQLVGGMPKIVGSMFEDRLALRSVKLKGTYIEIAYDEGKYFVKDKVHQYHRVKKMVLDKKCL